jgi:23S rRNA (guanosine2251-2'-O)-methyltransferase
MIREIMKKKSTTQGELIYGIHPIIEVLKAKRRKIITLYTTKPTPKSWDDIAKLLPERPIPIQYVERAVLDKMVETTDHQNVVAWVQNFVFRSKPFDPVKSPFLIMLDGIQDTRNVGAILRSAYCTGVNGVLLTHKHTAPLNASAIKASAGLAEHLEISVALSGPTVLAELKQAGYAIYLATFDGKNAAHVDFPGPTVIVIGSEGEGISPTLMKLGTHITLAQRNSDISYNASVAAGILLYLVATQKKII